MPTLPEDLLVIDFDNHYYEPRDAFTRYIDEEYKVRSLRFETGPNNENFTVLNGEALWDWPDWNVPLDPDAGTEDFFGSMEAEEQGASPRRDSGPRPEWFSAVPVAWREPGARVDLLDEQGLHAALMFPSLGVEFHEQVSVDRGLLMAMVRAFNRWLEDDWGYVYRDRLYSFPMIALADIDEATDELQRVIGLGAKGVLLQTTPVEGRSPADPAFDQFWRQVCDADLLVTFHLAGVSPYNGMMNQLWGDALAPPKAALTDWSPFLWTAAFSDRPAMDMAASLIFWNLFGRFPDARVAFVEYGVGWVEYLLRRMDKMQLLARHGSWAGGKLEALPSEVFRRHISVVPFPEDRIDRIVSVLGSQSVLFGSDFPHPEGLRRPLGFVDRLGNFDGEQVRDLMGRNAARLLGLPLND